MDVGSVGIEIHGGGARLKHAHGETMSLHPLWLRERVSEPEVLDPNNHQRLYEPNELAPDTIVVGMDRCDDNILTLQFSDGYVGRFAMTRLLAECGWLLDPELPPAPLAWTGLTGERTVVDYARLNEPDEMRRFLQGFFESGFAIIRSTPHQAGDLDGLAQMFGYIRETNWGRLFDVFAKPSASDLAYTGLALAAHTDNPYRFPVPGIQFLHCLSNTVAGGFSTIVDGLALVERLSAEAPDEAHALETLPVRFRYDTANCIVEDTSTLIERDNLGRLQGLRLSSRLDFVIPAEHSEMELFYAGRRRMQKLAADPEMAISFPFEPGMLLMMDNRRTLHGRTAYDGASGSRHLQGCYIDHDGPRTLWRTLARDGVASLGREAA